MGMKQTSCIRVAPTRYESNRKRPTRSSKEIPLCFGMLFLCLYCHSIYSYFKLPLMTLCLHICLFPLIPHSLPILHTSLHDSLFIYFSSLHIPQETPAALSRYGSSAYPIEDIVFSATVIQSAITIQDYVFHACSLP